KRSTCRSQSRHNTIPLGMAMLQCVLPKVGQFLCKPSRSREVDMAHILIVSRYYPPEIGVAGVCVSETATRLVKLGHQVTVLTTVPNYPTGIVPKEYRGHLILSEVLDGVRVVRVWCYIAPNKGFFRRVLAQFSFGCLAPFLAHKAIGHPDVIIVE